MHYQRLRSRGTTDDPPKRGAPPEVLAELRTRRKPSTKNTCGHPDRKHYAKERCRGCYARDFFPATRWQKQNPEKARMAVRRAYLKRHGLTPNQWDAMWYAQGGGCANPGCDRVYPIDHVDLRNGLQVDHCHRTGKVRGLLCKQCNTALGHIDDDVTRLRGLIKYLGSLN